jgi:predicted  nucleic acid-binding Zn-ribbon protein
MTVELDALRKRRQALLDNLAHVQERIRDLEKKQMDDAISAADEDLEPMDERTKKNLSARFDKPPLRGRAYY